MTRHWGWILAMCMGVHLSVHAQGEVFVCIDAAGRTITHDRPIRECIDREQRVLNRDGSLNRIIGPSLSPDERAAAEAEARRQRLQQQARLEEMRRDRNLMQRYPNEEAHERARHLALEQPRVVMRAAEERKAQLAREREPLISESEFYKDRELPPKLRQELDFNSAASDLQVQLISRQIDEMRRINERFDDELDRLRLLWNGSPPGPETTELLKKNRR